MRFSNEERREVADRLRVYSRDFDFSDSDPFWYVSKAAFGDVDVHTYCSVFARLADLIEPQPIDGNTSDGYHTFNELYHHRAVLFSVIVGNFATRAWKSKLHADGTMYEGMFIVGIETPDGQATYHYDVEPYWNLFRCKEVDRAPEWDGHTPGQAISRIGKLVGCEIDRPKCERIENDQHRYWRCSRCGAFIRWDAVTNLTGVVPTRYCPNCGAEVVDE